MESRPDTTQETALPCRALGTESEGQNRVPETSFPAKVGKAYGVRTNVVQGNFIGTDLTGTIALLGQGEGVAVGDYSIVGGRGKRHLGQCLGECGRDGGEQSRAGQFDRDGCHGEFAIGCDPPWGTWMIIVRGTAANNNTIGGTTPGLGDVLSGKNQGGALAFTTEFRKQGPRKLDWDGCDGTGLSVITVLASNGPRL